MRIDFTNAVVEDDGYGVEVNGRSLEAIISTALGTRLGDKGGYSSGLPKFKANSCDVTVIITPHPTECTINTTSGIWPVSYTHLDVYKRQMIECAFEKQLAFKKRV